MIILLGLWLMGGGNLSVLLGQETSLKPVVQDSQIASGLAPEAVFAQRVNSLSDFIRLFNHQLDDLSQAEPSEVETLQLLRRGVLELLFTPEALQRANDSVYFAQQYANLMGDLCSPSICPVDLADERLYARVDWQVRFMGKDTSLLMVLQKERLPEGAAKWVIRAVSAPFLAPFPKDSTQFIPPNSSDLMFIHLAGSASVPMQAYTASDFQPDPLTAFLFLVNQGWIELRHARQVELHLLPTPEWLLVIRETDTSPPQTGWLVVDFAPIEPDVPYLQQLLTRDPR